MRVLGPASFPRHRPREQNFTGDRSPCPRGSGQARTPLHKYGVSNTLQSWGLARDHRPCLEKEPRGVPAASAGPKAGQVEANCSWTPGNPARRLRGHCGLAWLHAGLTAVAPLGNHFSAASHCTQRACDPEQHPIGTALSTSTVPGLWASGPQGWRGSRGNLEEAWGPRSHA